MLSAASVSEPHFSTFLHFSSLYLSPFLSYLAYIHFFHLGLDAIIFQFSTWLFLFFYYVSSLLVFSSSLRRFAHLLCPVCCQTPPRLFHFPRTKGPVSSAWRCVSENSFPSFLTVDSVLRDFPSPVPASHAMLAVSVPWLMSPVPFSPPWLALGSPVLRLHNCCPASWIMSDASVASFISHFLARIAGRQKSVL